MLCCQQGKVRLPEVRPTPQQLQKLYESTEFRTNIRIYNSLMAMTSTGGKVDHTVTGTPGPFAYRIHGQNHHNIGSLLPTDGKHPHFLQMYVYDTQNEVENRMRIVTQSARGTSVNKDVVNSLILMLDETNSLAKLLRKARDRYEDNNGGEFNIRLISQKQRGRQYDLPMADEIGGLIVGDFSTASQGRDVILEFKSSQLQRISDLHPLFMSLQYPLLFPYGEQGYHEELPYQADEGNQLRRSYMTMREYYAYQIQTRLTEGMTIVNGGRLLHQYIVDAYTATEQERLRFLALNQKKLRADLYNHISDAVGRGDTDAKSIGKRIILPSSFTGGPRYMAEKYHDAMAICRWFGNPDLFITFTANPNCTEISHHLQTYTKEPSNSRPDLQCRMFKIKLDQMISDFNKGVFFPIPASVVYTIEFQKRGLPHAHILLWLKGVTKTPDSTLINKFISAELPDEETDKEGFELVSQHMMHGPCGFDRPQSTCMENGKCSKKYPRDFNEFTTVDKDGFILYRRRNDETKFVIKDGTKLDNRHVVPHNLELLKRYKAHINVEWCCRTSAIKYLFKYITKGVDRATFVIEKNAKSLTEGLGERNSLEHVNEISDFQECRYLSACEASWRLFTFHIHYHKIWKQPLVYESTENLEDVISRDNVGKTMFTGWMKANEIYAEARFLTYIEFPEHFCWHSSEKTWTPRKQGNTIGRIVNIHPSAGDLYYLRILVNIIRGPTCYDEILTVGDTIYKTCQEACYARGLLDDDREWHDVMEEVSYWATARQLRSLFVMLLLFCQVAQPQKLWKACWKSLADDILPMKRKEFRFRDYQLKDQELEQYALIEVEKLLLQNEKSLADYPDMPLPDKSVLKDISNTVLREELQFDVEEQLKKFTESFSALNEDQLQVYETVMDSIVNGRGKLFFVNGPGGTGKTFLYETIIAKLRSEERVVIPVASARIAALLLPGGRTAHSRFKIPINLTEESTCPIKPGTMLAGLISKADLIIWDEAPMAHRHTFEAVDKTIRDLMSLEDESALEKPFGGKTVLLGGDFRQILPVIQQGSRQDTVLASLNRSYLWHHCKVYELTKNMRLKSSDAKFARWILQVGDGNARKKTTNVEEGEGDTIAVAQELLVAKTDDYLRDITTAAYPDFLKSFKDHHYLTERAILTPRNETVHQINAYMLSMVPGEMKVYFCSDTIQRDVTPSGEWNSVYNVEYLNSLQFSGIPNHQLCLKVGVPVMLLRNLNQKRGLCNGTRLIINKLGNRVIEAEILTGTHVGDIVHIPRIVLSPNDSKHPFILRRRQFPLRICYAMTINKSQGQSLKEVALYLPQPVFSHGQLYVSLSRVTSPEGMKILDATSDLMGMSGVMNIVYKEIFNNIKT